MTIKLDVYVSGEFDSKGCLYAGHSFTVTFATEASAVDYVNRKRSYCAFWTRDDSALDEFGELLDVLYPTCEHGLSEILCMGPDHYPSNEQEMAMTIY